MSEFSDEMDKKVEEYKTNPKFKDLRIATEDALAMARKIGKGTTAKERSELKWTHVEKIIYLNVYEEKLII